MNIRQLFVIFGLGLFMIPYSYAGGNLLKATTPVDCVALLAPELSADNLDEALRQMRELLLIDGRPWFMGQNLVDGSQKEVAAARSFMSALDDDRIAKALAKAIFIIRSPQASLQQKIFAYYRMTLDAGHSLFNCHIQAGCRYAEGTAMNLAQVRVRNLLAGEIRSAYPRLKLIEPKGEFATYLLKIGRADTYNLSFRGSEDLFGSFLSAMIHFYSLERNPLDSIVWGEPALDVSLRLPSPNFEGAAQFRSQLFELLIGSLVDLKKSAHPFHGARIQAKGDLDQTLLSLWGATVVQIQLVVGRLQILQGNLFASISEREIPGANARLADEFLALLKVYSQLIRQYNTEEATPNARLAVALSSLDMARIADALSGREAVISNDEIVRLMNGLPVELYQELLESAELANLSATRPELRERLRLLQPRRIQSDVTTPPPAPNDSVLKRLVNFWR